MNTSTNISIRGYQIAQEGAMLLANIGPGSNPDQVVTAFTMIGMGDDARWWRDATARAQAASDALAEEVAMALPENATLFDTLLVGEKFEVKQLLNSASLERMRSDDAWKVLGEVISQVRGKVPGFDN